MQRDSATRFVNHNNKSDLQTHSRKVIGIRVIRCAIHDFLLVFHCNHASSILHRLRDTIAYFSNFKRPRVPNHAHGARLKIHGYNERLKGNHVWPIK